MIGESEGILVAAQEILEAVADGDPLGVAFDVSTVPREKVDVARMWVVRIFVGSAAEEAGDRVRRIAVHVDDLLPRGNRLEGDPLVGVVTTHQIQG